MTVRESRFQTRFINEVRRLFPGIIIVKPETGYIQGFPDRILLYMDKWATLEFKREEGASRQPNQKYYAEMLNRMSYSAFVCPENEEEILSELSFALQPSRNARAALR